MMAGSHIALGAAAWLVAAPSLGLQATSPVSLSLAVLGSLLPDIDHPKSWVGKKTRPLSNVISTVLGHRGVTHSLVAVAACGWLALHASVPAEIAWPLAIGYLSHLAGDLLTPRGLRLMWPVKGTWALPVCRTGGAFEPLVVALVLSFALTGTVGLRPDLRAAWDAAVAKHLTALGNPPAHNRLAAR